MQNPQTLHSHTSEVISEGSASVAHCLGMCCMFLCVCSACLQAQSQMERKSTPQCLSFFSAVRGHLSAVLGRLSGCSLQVPLGQPEVILWTIPLEPTKVCWLFVRSYQSVCDDVFHLELLFTVHQLWWWGLMSGPT